MTEQLATGQKYKTDHFEFLASGQLPVVSGQVSNVNIEQNMDITLQESAPTLIPQVFVNLGSVERIPLGEGREFVVDNEEIVVFRTREGKVYALQAKCPHRNGPLADGLIGGGKVICPYHAYKFELSTGQSLGNDCEALKTYTVEISENGEILLYF